MHKYSDGSPHEYSKYVPRYGACLAAMKQSIPAPLPRSTTTSTCRAMRCRGGCPTSWMGQFSIIFDCCIPAHGESFFSLSSPCLIWFLKLIAIVYYITLSSAIYKSNINPYKSNINPY